MKANELRIGNWYKNKSEDPLAQISHGHEIDYVAIYCEPIPLTEELLIHFGFDESMNDKYKYYLKPLALFRGLGDCNDRFYYFMSGQSKAIEIQYVHQLQNLYFALCGEELTIKS